VSKVGISKIKDQNQLRKVRMGGISKKWSRGERRLRTATIKYVEGTCRPEAEKVQGGNEWMVGWFGEREPLQLAVSGRKRWV
jgi:hypothetical protein